MARLVLYLGSLTALLVGLQKLKAPLEEIFGSSDPKLLFAVAGFPLAVVIFTDVLPTLLRREREKALKDWQVKIKPGYFRITPYEENTDDIKAFDRADGAHKDTLEWLLSTDESVLYLTGRSGSGKTSLLNCYLLPNLRKADPARLPIVVRSFVDPIGEIREELLRPGVIWTKPPTEEMPLPELLQRAARKIEPSRLLLILDQFEESLIIPEDAEQRIKAVEEFVSSLIKQPIEGVKILFVLRTDYIGRLEELHLPRLRQGDNWKDILAFTEPAARDFLANSGTGPDIGTDIGKALLDDLIRQAAEVEETTGLIRPITLNMIGIILERMSTPTGSAARTRKRLSTLFSDYVRSCLDIREIRDHAYRLVELMVTEAGTKKPRSIESLSAETGFKPAVVRGCLLALSAHGIVRRLESKDETWEVAHDFIARLLVHILGNWKRGFLQRIRSWLPVVVLLSWALLFWLLVPIVQWFRASHAIKGVYSTFEAIGQDSQQYVYARHLFTSPENYEGVKLQVKQSVNISDEAMRARLKLKERVFAERIFNLYETALYQLDLARSTRNRNAEKFLEEVVNYLAQRLLRNPRLLYFWSAEGGNLQLEYEPKTREFYARWVLGDPALPLLSQPDAGGPFANVAPGSN